MINQCRFDYVEGEAKGVISNLTPPRFIQHFNDDWRYQRYRWISRVGLK